MLKYMGFKQILIALLILSAVLNIALFVIAVRLKNESEDLSGQLAEYKDRTYEYEPSGVYDTSTVEVYDPSAIPAGDENEVSSEKKVYLTFDDGPSANTDRILDILDEYGVKATFFVTGEGKEKFAGEYIRIVEDGHTLGMHSYSHRYSEVYASADAFRDDFKKLQEYLYETTGAWSRIYRFPGGSSNTVSRIPVTEFIDLLNEEGIVYYDWNIVSGDAVEGGISAERITKNCLSGIDQYDECMILMHDAKDLNSTVEALPEIIETIKERGDCVILPITDETVPIQHIATK